MKGSLVLIGFFLLGTSCGMFYPVAASTLEHIEVEKYLLFSLLFLVGIGIGSDSNAIRSLLRMNFSALLIPVLVAIGSLAGAAVGSFMVKVPDLRESLAIGAGFGYYSLSSIIISQIKGEQIATIALLANIFREVFTILFAPILCSLFGKIAPIASGGATSMDTTLPIIHRCVGTRLSVFSLINGIVLTLLVPIIIPIILS